MKKFLLIVLAGVLLSASSGYSAQTFYNIETDSKRTILNAQTANDTELYSTTATNTAGILTKADKTGTEKITTTDDVQQSAAIVTEQVQPATPASGFGKIYAREGKAYFLNDAAVEIEITGVSDVTISMSDVTTNNVSTSQHGFAPKLSGEATEFLNGIGTYSVPAGGAGDVTEAGDNTFTGTNIFNGPTTVNRFSDWKMTDGSEFNVSVSTETLTANRTGLIGDYDSQAVAATEVGPTGIVTGVKTVTAGTGVTLGGTATDPIINSTGSSGVIEQAADPLYDELSQGNLVYATGSNKMFYKTADGLANTVAWTYTADPSIPTMTSATIPTSGDTISLLFSESITIGSGGNAGWTLNTPTNAMTYSSGDTTNTLIYSLASTINTTDTPTITYIQPGDGLESSTGGDLASIVAGAVDNQSEQGATTTYYVGFNNDHTTVLDDSVPGNNASSSNNGVYRASLLPAGATVTAIHVYKVSGTPTAEEVSLYTYVSATEGGALLSQADATTSDATWTRTPLTTGTRFFAAETQVIGGYAWTGTIDIGREVTGESLFKSGSGYGLDPLGAVTSSTYGYATIIEYTAP